MPGPRFQPTFGGHNLLAVTSTSDFRASHDPFAPLVISHGIWRGVYDRVDGECPHAGILPRTSTQRAALANWSGRLVLGASNIP